MSNLNKAIIITLVILIVGGLIGLFVLSMNNPNPIPAGNTKIIQSTQGPLYVVDYTQHPVQTTNDVVVLESTDDYQIVSFKTDNSFVISLMSKPLSKARTLAESGLLKDLNITQPQACTLKISVTTPNGVDKDYSGHELGLSFCPNAITLP